MELILLLDWLPLQLWDQRKLLFKPDLLGCALVGNVPVAEHRGGAVKRGDSANSNQLYSGYRQFRVSAFLELRNTDSDFPCGLAVHSRNDVRGGAG